MARDGNSRHEAFLAQERRRRDRAIDSGNYRATGRRIGVDSKSKCNSSSAEELCWCSEVESFPWPIVERLDHLIQASWFKKMEVVFLGEVLAQ